MTTMTLHPKILSVFILSHQSHSTAMLLPLKNKSISNFRTCHLQIFLNNL